MKQKMVIWKITNKAVMAAFILVVQVLVSCKSNVADKSDGEKIFTNFLPLALIAETATDSSSSESSSATGSETVCSGSPEFTIGELPYLVRAGEVVAITITVTKCGKANEDVTLKFSTSSYGAYSFDPIGAEYSVPKDLGSYTANVTIPNSLSKGKAYYLWADTSSYPEPRSTNQTAIPRTTSCSGTQDYKIEPIPDVAVKGASIDFKVTVFGCGYSSRSTSFHLSASNSYISYYSSSLVQSLVIPATTGTYEFTGTVPDSSSYSDGEKYYLGERYARTISDNQTTYIAADGTCTAPCNLTLNWDANREKTVNTAGGFYRIYYGATEGATDTYKDVPYVSGSSTPTTTDLNITASGMRYIHIKAFSALNSNGSESGNSYKLYAY